jgi:murein L,D-transpeptidase YafK
VNAVKIILLGAPVLVLAAVAVAAHVNFYPLDRDVVADRIVIEKATRRLTLFRGNAALKSYKVALGGEPLGAKQAEGDQRTPEGIYAIDYHKLDSDFHRALHLSYPNPDDIARATARGEDAGSLIMIHGLKNGGGWIGAFHRLHDWTAGCVAVTNGEIEEIFRAVRDGTVVEIRP